MSTVTTVEHPLARPHRFARPVPAVSAAVAALALVAAGAWAWQTAGTSTEVSVATAVDEFRDTGVGGVAAGDAPVPGVYSYAASGSETAHIGPISIDRDVPSQARYIVTPTPEGFQAELRISAEHTEAMRYAVGTRWIRATWRRVDVTFLRIGRDDRRPLTPAVPVVPVRPRVGQSWSVDFSAWKLRTTGTARVVRAETLTVAGAPVTTFLIETRTRTEGAHGGPRTERMWWAPRLGVPVRLEADTTLEGPVGYRSRVRLDLTSPAPAR